MGNLVIPGDVSEVSDGYHSFAELYRHRIALWINVCLAHRECAFRSEKNADGSQWEGWFILGLDHPRFGQMTYHLPDSYRDCCDFAPWKVRNYDYDGHTSEDVYQRLLEMAEDAAAEAQAE